MSDAALLELQAAAVDRRTGTAGTGGAAPGFTALIDPRGARLASLRMLEPAVELLATTPWADDDWDGSPPLSGSSAEWHRRYPGGWHVLAPHSGDARTLDGVEHPFHGEAAWRLWRQVDAGAASGASVWEVALRTVPLLLRRTFRMRADGVDIVQEFTNRSRRPVSFSWTEHPAFGPALIDATTVVELGERVLPVTFPAAGQGHGDFGAYAAPAPGVARIRNPRTGIEVTLSWDSSVLPHAFVWQEHHAGEGFPWWGQVDAIAVEPASRPYDADPESLGPLRLAPGESLASTVSLTALVVR